MDTCCGICHFLLFLQISMPKHRPHVVNPKFQCRSRYCPFQFGTSCPTKTYQSVGEQVSKILEIGRAQLGFTLKKTVHHSGGALSSLSTSWTSKPPLAVKDWLDVGALDEPGGAKSICSTLDGLLAKRRNSMKKSRLGEREVEQEGYAKPDTVQRRKTSQISSFYTSKRLNNYQSTSDNAN